MAQFQEGNKLGGRKKGSKNRFTNDVRACFHKVYEEMGENVEVDGRKQTGDEAFLAWARDNQTEFYRLYAKMIPQTAELPDDLHEDFVDTLVFEEEVREANAKILDIPQDVRVEIKAPLVLEMGKDSCNKPQIGVS